MEVDSSRKPDLTLLFGGHRDIPDACPSGVLLARENRSSGRGNALAKNSDSYIFRFPTFAEFIWSGAVAECWLAPDLEEEWASILAASAFMAAYAMVNGKISLHASVIDWNNEAIAFLGPSGSGKTTCAAAVCSRGARLLSDDVLVVERMGGVWHALPGAQEQRLRPEAFNTTDYLKGSKYRQTIDNRYAIRPTSTVKSTPLAKMIWPSVCGDVAGFVPSEISGMNALTRLLNNLRISGVCSVQLHQQLFSAAQALITEIPCFEIKMARGLSREPNFPDLLSALID